MDLVLLMSGPRLREQLERQLREAVRSGRLAAGTRLPATRALAADLGVSRGVVVEAYSQLVAEGWLNANRGGGTRVARSPVAPQALRPGPRPRPTVVRFDLRPGQPDPAAFPRDAYRRALSVAATRLADHHLRYPDGRGAHGLREALAEYLARARGVSGGAQQIVVSSGAAQAVGLLLEHLRRDGVRSVAIEDPCWLKVRDLIEYHGLRPVPVRVDEEGLDVDALARTDARAVFVTPAHQYPTGIAMAPGRRSELVSWAASRGALVIEDDYDAEYRYDRAPVAALQALAPDRVAYVGTASKTMAPGLRTGWLLPPERLVEPVVRLRSSTLALPGPFEQHALAHMIVTGEFERHLRRTRLLYRRRRDALIEALGAQLPELTIAGLAAGLHILVGLPAGLGDADIAEAAGRRGLALHTLGRNCAVTAPRPSALLLGYSLVAEQAMPAAIAVLADAFREANALRDVGATTGSKRR
ncbi:MAG: GntR family transcriptional regulator / MocR family aminotransferase [Solirubrobacteraceae bacterium]|nr:GntR family transcriptional regulator / MocR family aminotransferase [Solirubrobacteraceae bacterium]